MSSTENSTSAATHGIIALVFHSTLVSGCCRSTTSIAGRMESTRIVRVKNKCSCWGREKKMIFKAIIQAFLHSWGYESAEHGVFRRDLVMKGAQDC